MSIIANKAHNLIHSLKKSNQPRPEIILKAKPVVIWAFKYIKAFTELLFHVITRSLYFEEIILASLLFDIGVNCLIIRSPVSGFQYTFKEEQALVIAV